MKISKKFFLIIIAIFGSFFLLYQLLSNNKNLVSNIIKDDSFIDKLYLIRNPVSNSYIIVNGDGKIIKKTMDPAVEKIDIVDDIYENRNYYFYETLIDEAVVNDDFSEITNRIIVYDREGNDIGLNLIDVYINLSVNDKIIYTDYNEDYDGRYRLKVFDVKEKKVEPLRFTEVYAYNGNIILSTNPYSDDNKMGKICIYDDNFNEIKKIVGYSLLNITKNNDYYVAIIENKIKNEDGSFNKNYNFLDKDYNIIFDTDVDKYIVIDNENIVLVKSDIEFDYDFRLNKKSDERQYIERKSEYELLQEKQNEYEDEGLYLEKNKGYRFVDIFLYKDTLYYIGYKKRKDDEYNMSVDIYNKDFELVKTFDNLVSHYSYDGYLFVSHNSIYDKDLNLIKQFDYDCNLSRISKFDKVFFATNVNIDYTNRKDFTLFDDKFNALYENLDVAEFFTYDDYIVIVDKNNTKFVDKNNKIVKTIDRRIDIKDWYNIDKYRVFVDLDTNRMGIIDNNYNIVVDNLKNIEELTDYYFSYQNGFKYGLMDYKGIKMFSYSIFDTFREDSNIGDYNIE